MEQKPTSLQEQFDQAKITAQVAQNNLENAQQRADNLAKQAALTKARVEDLAAALGKQKLTDALALIEKVYKEAPKGSAAARDIEASGSLLSGLYLQKYVLTENAVLSGRRMSAPEAFAASYGQATAASVKAETSVGTHTNQAKPGPEHSGLRTCGCPRCQY